MNPVTLSRSHIDLTVFKATPGLHMLLRVEKSVFKVIAISNDLVSTFGLSRDDFTERDFFSLVGLPFQVNDGAVKDSLDRVVKYQQAHEVDNVRYNGSNPTSHAAFSLKNTPVTGLKNRISYIISTLTPKTREPGKHASSSIGTIEDAYQFFMNAPVIIGYLRGENYLIEFANDGLLKVWGRSNEVVGKPLFEAFPELLTQGTRELLDEVRLTGKPFFAYEHPLNFNRGGIRETLYFNFIYQAYYETADRSVATGVISVGHDVTEQVRIRDRFSSAVEQGKLLDNILRNSSNGISVSEMIFDGNGNVIDARTILANDAAMRFAGIPAEVYFTKTATQLDPGVMSSPYGQKCVETLRTGEPFLMQYHLDFNAKWLEVTVSKMDDSHLIHIFTDVTQVKQAQLELEKSMEDLRFANTNLEEFAYAASHDLKEPIRKIQFYSNKLRQELHQKLDDQQRHLFERLENSGARMTRLIDDLLEYSQAARGSSQREDIDLNNVLPSVLDDLDLEVQSRKAKVVFDALPVIHGNKRQIHQLFQNLIGNALKYSKSDVAPVISITTHVISGKDIAKEMPLAARDKEFYKIQLSDNGIGFEQRFADSIFNVFTRLHTGPQYRGSGIGLAIVKRVVDSHLGYIWAEGRPGEGSTFTILFPK